MFQIPYEKNLESFNLSNKRMRISYFIILTYCLYLFIFFPFLFLFLCHVYFAHDFLVGIFAMPIVFSLTFFLDRPFKFST